MSRETSAITRAMITWSECPSLTHLESVSIDKHLCYERTAQVHILNFLRSDELAL